MKKLVVLGSTGSIGRQTLDIVRHFPQEFQVIGLAGGFNTPLLHQQTQEFHPRYLCSADQGYECPNGVTTISMSELVALDEVEVVMVSTIGTVGLAPTLNALRHGKVVGLSNKEPIVMAGSMLKEYERTYGGAILPVDSEPSAIWQCLQGENGDVGRLIITASGGPFRSTPLEELKHVTPDQALRHPTWKMGRKITIDSATLMNKAFEVIESHWLFGVPWNKIEVVVHPQSTVHSMVEFADGSVKAQLGPPDMHLPIQYALFYPQRVPNEKIPRINNSVPYSLTFQPLDLERYPCFSLALKAANRGGTFSAVLSAADEVAVQAFLDAKIGFTDIHRVIEAVLSEHQPTSGLNVEEVLAADRWAGTRTAQVIEKSFQPIFARNTRSGPSLARGEKVD